MGARGDQPSCKGKEFIFGHNLCSYTGWKIEKLKSTGSHVVGGLKAGWGTRERQVS